MAYRTWDSLIEAQADQASEDVASPAEERAFVWQALQTRTLHRWSFLAWDDLMTHMEVDAGSYVWLQRGFAKTQRAWATHLPAAGKVPSAVRGRRTGQPFVGLNVDPKWARAEYRAAKMLVESAMRLVAESKLHRPWPTQTIGLGTGWEHLESPLPDAVGGDFWVTAAAARDALPNVFVDIEMGEEKWALAVDYDDRRYAHVQAQDFREFRERREGPLRVAFGLSDVVEIVARLQVLAVAELVPA